MNLDKDTVIEFYNLALYEYEKGTNITELKLVLKEYETQQMYLECAGIKLAIEYIEFLLILQLIIYKNKINDNNTDNEFSWKRTRVQDRRKNKS